MKYRAVIFDLDGVLCYTDRYHYQAWKAIATKLDINFNEEINNRLRGVSRRESFDIILEKYDGILEQSEKDKYIAEKNELYKTLLVQMTPADAAPGARELLGKLKELGIKRAVGSSSRNARFILDRIGLEDFFDVLSDGNNISASKPDPEVFLRAARLLEVENSRCLVVEDAFSGVQAARSAGMDCAAIGDAVSSPDAAFRLGELLDILNIVV